jgi:predicted metal-binding membrane protein
VTADFVDARSPLERMVRRDRLFAVLGLAVILALSWTYLVRMAADMRSMAAMGMPEMQSWGVSDFLQLFIMWTVMMVGMMLPSAAPLILLVLGVYRRRGGGRARLNGVLFVAGYLLAWTLFSAAAAASQVVLHRAALLSSDMAARSTVFAAVVLLIAGAYQWLPIKNSCLAHCRSPLDFLTRHWREGRGGALRMGLYDGLFCVGCCWALMALLFVAGVMNLLWVAAIAVFVLVEKLAPQGPRVGRVAGALLIIWGAYVLLRG